MLFLSFVSSHWRKFIFPIVAISVVAVFLLIPRGQANNSEPNLFPELIEEEIEEVLDEQLEIPTILVVDVKGAVRHPGVYTLEEGDRLIDAINAAGGYVPEADSRMLNHAMKLTDEFLVYVPLEGEEVPEGVGETSLAIGTVDQSSSDGTVNINTADESQLMTIPGIGPAKAAAIINYRTDNGPFKAPESLMDVSGIGKKTFEKLEHQITVK